MSDMARFQPQTHRADDSSRHRGDHHSTAAPQHRSTAAPQHRGYVASEFTVPQSAQAGLVHVYQNGDHCTRSPFQGADSFRGMLGPAAGPDRVVPRPNNTFKPRRRAMSEQRQAEFDTWLERWGLDQSGELVDWNEVFGGRPVVLDIGFGRGEGTVDMARADSGTAIVGIEVHTPGVVAVLDAIENDPLPHVRAVHGDVLRFLLRVPLDSLAGVRIYFPDPWPKKRHHARRLVRSDVVGALVDRLEVGGILHLATDIADYAQQMAEVCNAEDRLEGGIVPRPDWRPLTRFEQRGLDAGRPPTDLIYTRSPPAASDRPADLI